VVAVRAAVVGFVAIPTVVVAAESGGPPSDDPTIGKDRDRTPGCQERDARREDGEDQAAVKERRGEPGEGRQPGDL